MDWNQIWAAIGQIIVAGGGGAVIALGVFSLLGRQWIETIFNKQLEAYKAAQNRELERYKAEINALFGRITKIHEKEFEVLPIAWCKLQDALGNVNGVANPFQTYPDLRDYEQQKLEEFISNLKWEEADKEKLRQADQLERNNIYPEIRFWYDLNKGQEAVKDFHNFLLYNKIFLSSDLFDRFSNIDNALQDILIDMQYGKQSKSREVLDKGYKGFVKLDRELIGEVEKLVQKRLHYEEASEL